MLRFSGVIASTTEAGREAIVRLDAPVQGKKFAVVSYATKGRVRLMNGEGRLMKHTRVNGTATDSVDALRADTVELAKEFAD